jgi:hypothetical protein
MLDPITVIATASAAYNALKKGIEIGRELQDMSGQLLHGLALSVIWISRQESRGPSVVAVGSNVQAEAMEIFAAKKKIESTARRTKDIHPVLLRSVRVGGVAPY